LNGAEIGVRHGGLVDAGLFWNVVRDPVGNVTIGTGPQTFPTAGFIPAGGTLRQRQNVGRIAAWGLEMQGRYALGDHTALRYSGTWTHARVEASWANPQLDGKRPAQAPDYSLTFGFDTAWQKMSLSGDLTMDGRSFEDDLNSLPLKPSRRLDLRADYALTPHVTLYADLDNAFDDRIQIAHAGDGTRSFDNRRSLSIGVRLTQ
jgi:outer membrane receptor protein involved in Fe transport